MPYPHRLRDSLVIRDIQSKVKPPGPDGFEFKFECAEVIDRCWTFDPSERIKMEEVVQMLEAIFV